MGIINELKDIVALSKEAGISLSESISLYKMYQKDSSEDKKPDAEEKQEPKKTEEQDTGKEQPEGAPENEPQPEHKDNVIDYKSKYEEIEKKLEKLQQENAARDISGSETKKSDEDIINDITRSFM